MLWTKCVLSDGDRLDVQRFRLIVLALEKTGCKGTGMSSGLL